MQESNAIHPAPTGMTIPPKADRRAAILATLCLSLLPLHTMAEPAIVEYANARLPEWQASNNEMEASYQMLLEQAKQSEQEDAVRSLAAAKEHWEQFRAEFCRSMSQTYGGAWASTHQSDCRTKLADQFKNAMGDYGW
ncbi:lysozyme inhibitor LprI family protein [Pseudomonas tohonis]|nr:hypothetical protein L682_00965 [Pseudomonas alcaligenes OT 69]MDN4145909.1 lysozyme inhibitor LprI family protein [Pseudomonas tohonis]